MFGKIDGNLILGLSLSIVAMFSWSLCTVFLSRNNIGLNPYYSLGWQMILGSIMLFIIVHSTQNPIPIEDISAKSWLAIFYLIGAGSLLSFIAFIYSLKKLPPAISSLYAYINPIVAMISASILLQEKLTLTILMGTIVTLIGVYFVNHSVKRDQLKIIIEPEI
jgi:drug/metabolite transporter (DMT)-like permease